MRRNLFYRASLESLESRRLLSLSVVAALPDISVPNGSSPGSVSVAGTFTNANLAGNSIVQMQTSEGTITLELYDSQAPITVQNFLSYVNSGGYNNTLFYRAATNPDGSEFVIQTGEDYPVDADNNPINFSTPSDTDVGNIATPTTAAPTIPNEYSATRPNVEGTIAMAKQSGEVNSATTEWFINLADNSSDLDNQNGGFTVFGQVLNQNSFAVAQTIGNLPTLASYGATGSPYAQLPLINYPNGGDIEAGNLVLVPTVAVIPAITYSVASSNTAVVNPAVNGTSLSLAYGTPGTANVTVTATDVLGNTLTDVFAVTVEQPALAVTHNGTTVANGQSAPINFGFVPFNGSSQQTLVLTNNGDEALALSSFDVPSGFEIVGDAPTSIAAGTSANLVLAVDSSSTGVKSGTLSFDTNDPGTPIFSLPLSGTVAYSATVGTAGSTKAKTFTYTDAGGTLTTVTLTGPGTMTPYFFSDTAVSQSAVKTATNFAGSDLLLENLVIDATTAKSSLTITSKGGDGSTTVENLSVTSAINNITGKDVIFAGDVTLISAKSISVASANNTIFSGQSVATLSLSGNSDLDLALSGTLGSVMARGSLAGAWTAGTLGKLAAGSLGNFNLSTSNAVTSIAVHGAIDNSNLSFSGVKTITAGSMSGDKIQAGYNGSGFPPASGNLTANAAIGSLSDKGIFADSDLIAASLGSITLGSITTDNNGNAFGLAGETLKLLSTHADGKTIKLAQITTANAATAIASLGDLGDLQIDIL